MQGRGLLGHPREARIALQPAARGRRFVEPVRVGERGVLGECDDAVETDELIVVKFELERLVARDLVDALAANDLC